MEWPSSAAPRLTAMPTCGSDMGRVTLVLDANFPAWQSHLLKYGGFKIASSVQDTQDCHGARCDAESDNCAAFEAEHAKTGTQVVTQGASCGENRQIAAMIFDPVDITDGAILTIT